MQDSAAQGSLLSVLAQETEHFSGSDLYELCAEAASIPLYEDTTAQPQYVLFRASCPISVSCSYAQLRAAASSCECGPHRKGPACPGFALALCQHYLSLSHTGCR